MCRPNFEVRHNQGATAHTGVAEGPLDSQGLSPLVVEFQQGVRLGLAFTLYLNFLKVLEEAPLVNVGRILSGEWHAVVRFLIHIVQDYFVICFLINGGAVLVVLNGIFVKHKVERHVVKGPEFNRPKIVVHDVEGAGVLEGLVKGVQHDVKRRLVFLNEALDGVAGVSGRPNFNTEVTSDRAQDFVRLLVGKHIGELILEVSKLVVHGDGHLIVLVPAQLEYIPKENVLVFVLKRHAVALGAWAVPVVIIAERHLARDARPFPSHLNLVKHNRPVHRPIVNDAQRVISSSHTHKLTPLAGSGQGRSKSSAH